MRLITTFRVALKSLRANKIRSLLAMLGIIIGIAAVISMLAIGAGAEQQIMSRISEMGSNLLSIRPGAQSMRGVFSGAAQTLTLDDAIALLEQVPEIAAVSPVAQGNAQLKYLDKNTNVSVNGTAPTWPSIRNYTVEYGRFFSDNDVDRNARVVVLGSDTAEELEINQYDIGSEIKLKGISFTLIGLFEEKGGAGFGRADDVAVIPYTTSMDLVFGLDHVSQIDVQVQEGADVTKAEEDITNLLRERHRIQNPEDDDFRVFNQADIIQAASESSRTFTILLGAIASISLIVGGIGIMNIMLVTVTERTREIGIRKAIGAKERDILTQFLLEAIIMCVIGGLIGVGLGVGASYIIGSTSDFSTSLQTSGIILALVFSISVGIFFGFYPAQRAARLDPVDALAYE